MTSLAHRVLRRTSPDTGTPTGETTLRRSLSTFQLTMFGIGGTIGTGIFFILSVAVPEAGPAVLISFLIAGAVAGLTVLCYAELASVIPGSGSSYSYSYATLGELAAFGVGACLILEYGVSAAAVAVGWSEYVNFLLTEFFGWQLPNVLSNSPEELGIVNLPAVILVVLCTLLLVRGASESAWVNTVMVIIKVSVLLLFCAIAFTAFDSGHFTPFMPAGFSGVSVAAGALFFSFIGLDSIATTGEEVHNPRRAIPIALMAALVVVVVVYLLVAAAALGAQQADDFAGQRASLAMILQHVTGTSVPAIVLACGAVISIFSVTLVCLYGQTRILFAMGRDGLVPSIFSRIDRRTQVPMVNTFVVGAIVALLAGVLPMKRLAEMTSIGTLMAFALVSVGVVVLRVKRPDLPRGFRVPGYPVTPVLSVLACGYIVTSLEFATVRGFVIWIAVAIGFYFAWSIRNSKLERVG